MAYEVKKDPNADLDYGFDWTAWLGATDTITESTWAGSLGQRTHNAQPVDFDERQSHYRVAQIRERIWRGVCRDEPYQDGRGTRRRAFAAGDCCGSIGEHANAVKTACHGRDRLSFPDRDCLAWVHFPESRFIFRNASALRVMYRW